MNECNVEQSFLSLCQKVRTLESKLSGNERKMLHDFIESTEKLYEDFFAQRETIYGFLSDNVKAGGDEDATSFIKRIDRINEKIKSIQSYSDLELRRMNCQKKYKGYWERFSDDTREYLAQGACLLSVSAMMQGDTSPAILEMSCALENELRTKIFSVFIQNATLHFCPAENQIEERLHSAVKEYRSSGDYYIPFSIMFICLENMVSTFPPEDYQSQLQEILRKNGWNIDELTERSFIDNGKRLVMDIRNKAAHAGMMTQDDASECNSLVKDILIHLINCMPKLK